MISYDNIAVISTHLIEFHFDDAVVAQFMIRLNLGWKKLSK